MRGDGAARADGGDVAQVFRYALAICGMLLENDEAGGRNSGDAKARGHRDSDPDPGNNRACGTIT